MPGREEGDAQRGQPDGVRKVGVNAACEVLTQFVAITVGGLASVEGSIFGATFVVLIPALFGSARWAVPVLFGAAILLVLIFEPGGLAGRLRKARLYLEQWPFR